MHSFGQQPRLSVIIPAHNEQSRLAPNLVTLIDYLKEAEPDHEIIVVDDGSADETAARAREIAADWPRLRVIQHLTNRGKGAAVRSGVLAASGRQILFSDADLATPIDQLRKLQAALDQGCDIAIGSRAVPGADIRVHQSPARELMGRGFNLIVRAASRLGIQDTQCGFKLFTRKAGHDLFRRMTIDHFAFDVEILMLARGRYRVAEVPVVWRHMQYSTVSPGTDALRMFFDVLKVRFRHRRVT